MIYQRIPPQPALQAFVKEYLLLHFVYDPAKPTLVKAFPPLPEHGLEFFPKGLVTSDNPLTGEVKKAPRNAVFGQQVSRINFVMPAEDYVMIRVIFHAGGLFRLLRIPLTEFTDKKIDAEAVINQEVRQVNDRLANTINYREMIAIVEHYLLGKIRRVKSDIHAADKIGAILLHNPTRFSLDWLADQACLSPRQLERKFVERMGIGPKLFGRIARFHKAFLWKEANPEADWLSVAVKFGYTDFHHLFKDFKEFAGVTPNTLLSESARSPEKVLRLT
ncbi:AraC family transcriptional regulator [Spirosoma sp. BT702]|uniref:AraC family transcriptional regulator n=1 Tax=Spirosoma profusum TaxID=2771354 RepID=A0A927AVX0_9BACT|nr:helix-turn-helix domain-containing protein [Spirosoma profusum]MBD2705356.1 AraC family transcriptional regulator [Spirosoma profusum]